MDLVNRENIVLPSAGISQSPANLGSLLGKRVSRAGPGINLFIAVFVAPMRTDATNHTEQFGNLVLSVR